MADKEVRISKVLKEFGIGIDHVVEFLSRNGYQVDKNPNSKIPAEAYALLEKEFARDKAIKEEAKTITREILNKENKVIEARSVSEQSAPADTISDEELRASLLKQKLEADKKKKVGTRTQPKQDETEVIKVPILPAEPKVVGRIKVEEIPGKSTKKKSAGKQKETEATAHTLPAADETKQAASETKAKKPSVSKEQTDEESATISASIPDVSTTEPVATQTVTLPAEQDETTAVPPKEEEPFRLTPRKTLKGPTIVDVIQLPPESTRKKPVASSAPDEAKRKKRRRTDKKVNIQEIEKGLSQPSEKEKPGIKKGPRKPEPRTEITESDIQEQIKATLARLTAGKSKQGARLKRARRESMKEEATQGDNLQGQQKKVIKVTEFVTVNELARLMDVPVTQIISACLALGHIVSINQRLDADTLLVVAEEFGCKVEFVSVDVQEAIEEKPDAPEDLQPRPPIITVMGHVDHGKTSLLDYIRKTNVIAGEAGGITQHIGAYSVTLENGKKITFLDTPGHEAFTAMRARGARVTDLAIIVIAADDSVMPQTVEAINHAQAAGVPIVFAFNKMDKPGASADKIREQLAKMNILVEEWGGKYQTQEISAKTGMGVDALLEKVLVEAELLDLKANPDRHARGTVIESSLDKGRGYVCTVLVQNGTLRPGNVVLAGCYSGKVKAMFNERGQKMESAGPSTPVMILGLNGAPQAGDQFHVMPDEREAREIANKRLQLQREQAIRTHKHITLDEISRRMEIGNFKELNIIVKGDVDGSIEALSDALLRLSTNEIQVNIIHKAVGPINESDVMLASASNAIIIGFQVRPTLNARKLAEQEQIEIRLYSIIYDAINEIKSAMEGMLAPEYEEKITCNAEVREIFKIPRVGTVAGCMVLDGKLTRNTKIRVIRDGIVAFTGELASLKRFKDDVKEVPAGYECGLSIASFNDIKMGDIIEGYEQVAVKRTLV
jgi:translation initiation factor IF-2